MTKRKADSHDFDDPSPGDWWKFFAMILGVPALVLLWIAFDFMTQRLECVVLPNGATIEYSSFWSLPPESDWHPTMTLRDASGRVLTKTNSDLQFFRVPTISGMVLLRYGEKSGQEMIMNGRVIMPIIYGKSFSGENWNEPRKGFPHDTSITFVSLKGIHHFLRDHEEYRRRWCRSIWQSD